MRDKLHALLGIESGEESMVSMLLTQSVFLGFFLGAYDITGYSQFLSVFDEKMMARGYVVSGSAGVILTVLYSWFQSRTQFRNFALINLIIMTVLTVFLSFGLIFSPVKWMIFIVFVLLGPLNILVLLSFRETAGRLFTQIQQKRLLPLIDSGLVTGIIVVSFAIPVFLFFKFKPQSLLFISAFSLFLATIIQVRLRTKLIITDGEIENYPEKPGREISISKTFREDRYMKTIASFAALSVVTAFFIQYSFMAVTREQYPAAGDMARFLGLFTGGMMILILFAKLVVFNYILHKYSLRTCLVISPVLIVVFTVLAVTTGLLIGYSPESALGFLIFFVLLALSRLFSKTLRDSFEYSSLKVIYYTIDEKTSPLSSSGTAGTFNEIAVILSGLILAGFGIFGFVKLIHFSLLLIIIASIWIFVAFRLYNEYRRSVRKATEEESNTRFEEGILNEQYIFKNRFAADIAFKKDYFRLIAGDYSVLNDCRNKWYFEKIIDCARSEMDINLLPVLKRTAANAGIDEEIRRHSTETSIILEKFSGTNKSGAEKNLGAKKVLSGTRMPQATEILRLFRDNSIESKRLALFMIGKFKISDLISEVCECLNTPGLETDAYEVLKTFGTDAEDQLVRFFLISSGNTGLSKRILRLIGNSCTLETSGFLFSRLWSNSRQLKEVALKCLIDCKFKTSEEEKERLHLLTSEVIGLITWNIAARISLEKSNYSLLPGVMIKETDRWKEFLFNILTITYGSGSIGKIMGNLESGTFERFSNALEMIDVVINDSVKSKLISLFDNVSDEVRIKNLSRFYPFENSGINKLLEVIINRDYNLISLWTKACTLRSIPEFEDDEMAESVVALLFSPEEILQEESAKLVARTSRELYRSASQRLSDSTRLRLDKIVNGTTVEKELIFEKVLFLSKWFKGIKEEELLQLAGAMKYVKNIETEAPQFSGFLMVWPLSVEKVVPEVYILYDGEIDKISRKYTDTIYPPFYFLPLSAVEEFHLQFPDKSPEILKYIDINEEQ
jgi:ATP:ADP antiporter, AAA family